MYRSLSLFSIFNQKLFDAKINLQLKQEAHIRLFYSLDEVIFIPRVKHDIV